MATQSSILAWKIPWREEPGKVQSIGLQRVGHDWVSSVLMWLCFQGAGMPPQDPEGLTWAWRVPGPSQKDGGWVQHPLPAHSFFFFLRFIWYGPFLKSFEFVTMLFLLHALVFWPWGTRGGTCTSCVGRQSVNPGTTREVPTRSSHEATLDTALTVVPVTWQMEFWGQK